MSTYPFPEPARFLVIKNGSEQRLRKGDVWSFWKSSDGHIHLSKTLKNGQQTAHAQGMMLARSLVRRGFLEILPLNWTPPAPPNPAMDAAIHFQNFQTAWNTLMRDLAKKWDAAAQNCGDMRRQMKDEDEPELAAEFNERQKVYWECAEQLRSALNRLPSVPSVPSVP